jgi:hypothetical protein
MAFKQDDVEVAEGGLALCAAIRALVPATGETAELIDEAQAHFQAVLSRGKKKPGATDKPTEPKKGS